MCSDHVLVTLHFYNGPCQAGNNFGFKPEINPP
jgi:hypothetical protein